MMHLVSRKKLAHGRCVTPEETIARLDAIIRPRHEFRVHEETVHPLLHWSAMFLDDDPDFRAMGKGTTRPLAMAGALAEAAEWLGAREIAALPGYRNAHQRDIERPLPIEDLLPHIATATPPVVNHIKTLDTARHWVDGWSLLRGEPVNVPLAYVRLIGGPNGKASGNFIEEALVHALLEIFERRAHVTVLRQKLVVPTIDPDSIPHPTVREQLAFVRDMGIEVTLKDLSFGGTLPCIGAYFSDPFVPDDYQFHHFFKVGASFDRAEALTRIFTEFVQGRRHDEFRTSSPKALARILEPDFRQLRTRGADCDNFLSSFMFGMVPYRDAGFLLRGDTVPFDPDPGHDDCLDDISHALRVCETLGKDCIAVDLTDPDTGFPVVQAIVPGYSDVLPYHPAESPGLHRTPLRSDILRAFASEPA
jgi:ribosomal protein S12 methylthiotransferase accessory factor YcaO